MGKVALFDFANHAPDWLEKIDRSSKPEPWGKNKKILELYLRNNFEIAKQQGKVYEDEAKGFAIWRAGYLCTPTVDPIWLYYEKNSPKYKQKWNFKDIKIGNSPLENVNNTDYCVKYDPPEFNSSWDIYIDPTHFDTHILGHNHDRLISVLDKNIVDNSHRFFRTIYGEIMLEKKEAAGVMPQWYMDGYNFLMPLFLTQPNKIDLTAALTIDTTNKRYQLRTLLLPHYAYANARSIVKSRTQFVSWAIMDEKALSEATYDDKEDEEE